jgi:outer membrane protein assembly factor BamA
MSLFRSSRSALLGLLCAAGLLLGTPLVSGAQDADAPPDSSHHPNHTPYATDRSVAYHVLAGPAYLLHAATRPLGWGVQYVTQRFPNLLQGRRPPAGILPIVEVGGPAGLLGGLALYDNTVLGTSHSARIEGLYGGPDTFEGELSYGIPAPFGPGTQFDLRANLFSDPESEFYRDGNDSDETLDETVFGRDQVDVTARVQFGPSEQGLRGQFGALYEHVETAPGDDSQGRRFRREQPAGTGEVDLLTARLSFGLDRTSGAPRTAHGTEVLLRLDYTQDLKADRFRYGRYVAEVRQYLPVGIFPDSRRLVLRGRLAQTEPLFDGEDVPFFQRPGLGGQNLVRGFRFNRFQDVGSLVLNAEYRYPIWSNFDALLFVDAGQVFPSLSSVAVDRFHWSYGGGLHMLNQSGLSFRFEVAGSTEGVRTILTVDPLFKRLAR